MCVWSVCLVPRERCDTRIDSRARELPSLLSVFTFQREAPRNNSGQRSLVPTSSIARCRSAIHTPDESRRASLGVRLRVNVIIVIASRCSSTVFSAKLSPSRVHPPSFDHARARSRPHPGRRGVLSIVSDGGSFFLSLSSARNIPAKSRSTFSLSARSNLIVQFRSNVHRCHSKAMAKGEVGEGKPIATPSAARARRRVGVPLRLAPSRQNGISRYSRCTLGVNIPYIRD